MATIGHTRLSPSTRFVHHQSTTGSVYLHSFIQSVIYSFIHSFSMPQSLPRFVHQSSPINNRSFIHSFSSVRVAFPKFLSPFPSICSSPTTTTTTGSIDHSFIHSFIHSLIHSVIHSNIHSVIHSQCLGDSVPPTDLFITNQQQVA